MPGAPSHSRVITIRAVPNTGFTVFGRTQIVVSTIWLNTDTNSSANKQMHGFAYFDKYYAVPTLTLVVISND